MTFSRNIKICANKPHKLIVNESNLHLNRNNSQFCLKKSAVSEIESEQVKDCCLKVRMLIFSKSPTGLNRSRITFDILDIFYLYLFFLLSPPTRDCRVICQGFSVTKRYNCFRPFGHVTQPAHLRLLHHSIIVDDKLCEIDCDLYTRAEKTMWTYEKAREICYAKASCGNLVQSWEKSTENHVLSIQSIIIHHDLFKWSINFK